MNYFFTELSSHLEKDWLYCFHGVPSWETLCYKYGHICMCTFTC